MRTGLNKYGLRTKKEHRKDRENRAKSLAIQFPFKELLPNSTKHRYFIDNKTLKDRG